MKKYLICLLASAIVLANVSLAVAAKQDETPATRHEKVKIRIAKLGVGEKAKATVFLKDGTKKKGYIAQSGDDDFILRDRKTDVPSTLRYTDVLRVDNNRGHSLARNVGLGVAIGAVSVLTVLGVIIARDN